MASTREELAAVTVRRTVPSAMKMLWPTAMFLNAPGWGNGSTPGSVVVASGTKLTVSPRFSRTGSSSVPKRSLMPPKSWRMATGRPCFLEMRLMLAITSACSSKVPWEKFRRAQSIPIPMSWSNMSGSLVAGPMVTMIFVLRMVPASLRLDRPRMPAQTGPDGL